MKLKYIFSIAAMAMMTGCNDGFLERSPQSVNDMNFWSTPNDLKTYANSFYGILPGGVTNLGDQNSDNQVPNGISSYIWGQYVVPTENGNWSKGNWSNIRKINYFMTHYKTVQGTEEEINKWVAEVRFFRALEYFSKIKTFGDVPWLDKDLNVDSEELFGGKMKRNEVAKKIVEDLDFAITWLPEAGSEEANRLNKDIARHIKARVCLHEGTYYKYHTELGYSDDAKKLLELAASASDDIINSGNYEIYNTGNPGNDYYDLFIMQDKKELKEAILYIDYKYPLRVHNMGHGSAEANCGFSKDFADCFLYNDGKPKALTSKNTEDNTILQEMTDRDPRFAQMIYNDNFLSEEDKKKPNYDDAFVYSFCLTGYRSIKGYNPETAHKGYNVEDADGIAYRYAETLLINAEAKAELLTINQKDLDRTINQLRRRVKMPDLKMEVGFKDPNWPEYGYELSDLLQEIRRERRIELAGEGFRFDDLCRWKAGHLLNNVNTYIGKKVTKGEYVANNGCVIVYANYTNEDLSYQEGKSRTWNDKMYLYPIPTGELQRNPNLLPQNPGW